MVNESNGPPWLTSSTDAKQPPQDRPTSSMLATSDAVEGPPKTTLKPVPEITAGVTVTVPAKPGIALIAAARLALLYASPEPPMTAESLPPIRTWNGEKWVRPFVPELLAPDGARPAIGAVYSNVRGDGTAVIVKVPL